MQVDRLKSEILPRLRKNLELLQSGYQAGANQVAFSDILLAQESLNSSRLNLVEGQRDLWVAIADLQGLMQLYLDQDLPAPGSAGQRGQRSR